MKTLTIFLVLFFSFLSYGQARVKIQNKTSFESPAPENSKDQLRNLQSQLEQYVDSLMLILLSEDSSKETQMGILDEIKSIAEVNGKIAITLNEISQNGRECERIENCVKADDVWVKAQSELIRRKQASLDDLIAQKKELADDFHVELALDAVVILAGGVLLFVPAGQPISAILTAGRLSLTGKRLGMILVGTGVFESGVDTWNYFFGEEEQKALSFVSEIVIRDAFAREMFHIMSYAELHKDKRDRYLAENLSISQTEEELIDKILQSVQKDDYSVSARQSVLRALRAFPDMERL